MSQESVKIEYSIYILATGSDPFLFFHMFGCIRGYLGVGLQTNPQEAYCMRCFRVALCDNQLTTCFSSEKGTVGLYP